jgi:hypothetical protein
MFALMTACKSVSAVSVFLIKKDTRTHILEDKVDIFIIVCLQHVQEGDDVFVVGKALEKDNLSEGSLCVCGVLKRTKDLLQSNHVRVLPSALLVFALPYNTIRLPGQRQTKFIAYSLSQELLNIKSFENVGLKLFVAVTHGCFFG